MTERFQATVAAHLFLLRGNEVLLLRRHNTGYEDGNYSVIAGHLDGDEPARLAMVREAAEEAGIQVAPSDLNFVHVMHRKETGETDERIDLFFAATNWRGEPANREPEKCSELRWSALDDLPANVVPYVRAALEHFQENRPYAEFWPALAATANSDEPAPVVRPAVRVVVIDADERVLLFASQGDDGRRFWFPPGGGSEPGETPEETARRELREETGLIEVALDGEIGRRRHIVTWDGVAYDLNERWLLARVAPFAIDTSGFSEEERTMIEDHCWWTLDELESTVDRLVPGNLAALVRSLLREGLPSHPIALQR
ncbi:MAG: NUDIX domain-containing protein [Thermomicrobiales bacterium]